MRRLAASLVFVLAALALTSVPAAAYSGGQTGYDISWPQCGAAYPSGSFDIAIVGVTGGRAFTHNGCLASEVGWAAAHPGYGLYLNLNAPVGSTASRGSTGPAGTCRRGDKLCVSYNYGWNAAQDAWSYAVSSGASSAQWWLDVETTNSWTSNLSANARVVQGALDFLAGQQVAGAAVKAGVYSTTSQWGVIVGSAYRPQSPVWYATAGSATAASGYCSSSYAFTGGAVSLVQFGAAAFDGDLAC